MPELPLLLIVEDGGLLPVYMGLNTAMQWGGTGKGGEVQGATRRPRTDFQQATSLIICTVLWPFGLWSLTFSGPGNKAEKVAHWQQIYALIFLSTRVLDFLTSCVHEPCQRLLQATCCP